VEKGNRKLVFVEGTAAVVKPQSKSKEKTHSSYFHVFVKMVLAALLIFCAPHAELQAQLEEDVSQGENRGDIGTDRNSGFNNEGYLHSIPAPTPPCGATDLVELEVRITLRELEAIDPDCAGFEAFANIYSPNCGPNGPCPAQTVLFSERCGSFRGTTTTGTFELDLLACNIGYGINDDIQIDVILNPTGDGNCDGEDAISAGLLAADYTIRVTWIYDSECDDGDDCTVDDQINQSNCMCEGEPADCRDVSDSRTCDDGDPAIVIAMGSLMHVTYALTVMTPKIPMAMESLMTVTSAKALMTPKMMTMTL